MSIFKTFTLKWWQTGLFKLGMLTLGIAIGTYWHALFGGCLVILTIAAAVSLAYISHLWWKQQIFSYVELWANSARGEISLDKAVTGQREALELESSLSGKM